MMEEEEISDAIMRMAMEDSSVITEHVRSFVLRSAWLDQLARKREGGTVVSDSELRVMVRKRAVEILDIVLSLHIGAETVLCSRGTTGESTYEAELIALIGKYRKDFEELQERHSRTKRKRTPQTLEQHDFIEAKRREGKTVDEACELAIKQQKWKDCSFASIKRNYERAKADMRNHT